jgi:hypothetical protein
MGESLKRNRRSAQSKYPPRKQLFIAKITKKNSNLMVEKPGRHHLPHLRDQG